MWLKRTALFGVGKHNGQYCNHLNEPTSKSTVASACQICFLMVRPQKKVEQLQVKRILGNQLMFSMPLFEIVQVSPQNLLDYSGLWVHDLRILDSGFDKSELASNILVLFEPLICTALFQFQVLGIRFKDFK